MTRHPAHLDNAQAQWPLRSNNLTVRLEEKRMPIEQVAPELQRLINLEQEVEWLGSGFGADATPLGLPW